MKFLKNKWMFFQLTFRLLDFIYISIVMGSVGILIYLFFSTHAFLNSEQFLKFSFTLVFFMVSILSGVCVKVYKHKNYICPIHETHIHIVIRLLRYLTWFLLLLGISYGLYMFESYSNSLIILGYIVDSFVAILLLFLFFNYIKILQAEIKS